MTGSTLSRRDLSPLPINDLPPLEPIAATTAVEEIRTALTGESGGILWVHGAGGTGKTTAVRATLEGLDGYRGIKYIRCHPRLRLEETLYPTSDFLQQLGIDGVARVLDQRSRVTLKLAVLLDVLQKHPLLLWFDDLHALEVGDEEGSRDALTSFLAEHARQSADAAGRIVVASEAAPPPDVPALVLKTRELSAAESRRLWRQFGSRGAESEAPFPEALEALPEPPTPLELRLLFGVVARGGPQALEEALAPGGEPGLPHLHETACRLLSDGARNVLEILTAYQRPASRQALRQLMSGVRVESLDAHARELAASGFMDWTQERGSTVSGCALHVAVGAAVEKQIRDRQAGRFEELLTECAKVSLKRASRSEDLWHLYEAYTLHFAAARYEDAYALQKHFMEDLLRFGYLDLARKVLAESIATTSGAARAVALGNLAIIHKNEARYERALELYQRVLGELQELGDLSNLARVLHQLGNTHYLKGDLEEAYSHYRRSMDISDELGDSMTLTATQVQVANVLFELGRSDEALEGYGKALVHLETTSNASLVAAVKLQMGQVHFRAGRYLEAEALFDAAEEEAVAADDRRSLLKVFRGQALVASKKHDHDHALERYRTGEQVAKELGDVLEVVTFHLLQGEVERQRLRLGPALVFCLRARDMLRSLREVSPAHADGADSLAEVVQTKLDELAETMGPDAYRRGEESYLESRD